MENFKPEDHFTLEKIDEVEHERIQTKGQTQILKIHGLDDVPDFYGAVHSIFEEVINRMTVDAGPEDKCGFEISHPELDTDLAIPLSKKGNLTATKVMTTIEKVQQSKKAFKIDDDIIIKVVTCVKPLSGGTFVPNSLKRKAVAYEEHGQKKSKQSLGIVTIKNSDNMCFARALAVCIAHHRKGSMEKRNWENIRDGDRQGHMQLKLAKNILHQLRTL
jgi:hypothetical protein